MNNNEFFNLCINRGFSNIEITIYDNKEYISEIENEKINRMGIPKKDIDKMNDIINDKYGIRFIDDEEWRLARVLYEPILQGKVEQATLASWIKSLDFLIEEREDFYKFSNFRSCLLEVYIQLDKRHILQDDLKEAIQSFQY